MHSAETDWLIQFDKVCLSLNDQLVLDKINFFIIRGKHHLLLGPNGAGKSSLATCLLGLQAFTGTITTRFSNKKPTIGYVPQSLSFNTPISLSVSDFLSLCWWQKPIFIRKSTNQKIQIRSQLEKLDSEHLANKPLYSLSGGELRRILLCQALFPKPELLILDEPTNHTDEATTQIIIQLCQHLLEIDTTLLTITHDTKNFIHWSDNVTVLNKTQLFSGSKQHYVSTMMQTNTYSNSYSTALMGQST